MCSVLVCLKKEVFQEIQWSILCTVTKQNKVVHACGPAKEPPAKAKYLEFRIVYRTFKAGTPASSTVRAWRESSLLAFHLMRRVYNEFSLLRLLSSSHTDKYCVWMEFALVKYYKYFSEPCPKLLNFIRTNFRRSKWPSPILHPQRFGVF